MEGERLLRAASSLDSPTVMPLRATLGDVEIVGDPMLSRLMPPMVGPMMPRAARPLRATLGNVDILGDLNLTPAPASDLPRIGRIGWWWDVERQQLCGYVTTDSGTYCVRLPLARVWRAFAAAAEAEGCPLPPVVSGRDCTVDGLFASIKRAVKKVTKKVVPAKVRRIANRVQRKFAPIVRRASKAANRFGRGAIKVASHPAFGAVMGAMAVAPPLTAIGGAGLAAYSAANVAKRVVHAADAARAGLKSGAAAVRQLGRGGAGRAVVRALRDPRKAALAAQRIAQNVRQLPSRGTPSARLTLAALRSVPR